MNFTTMCQYFIYAQKKYKAEHDNGLISNHIYFKKYLVLSRLMAQHTIDKYNNARDEYNEIRRMKERFKHQGVEIATLNMQINVLLERCREIKLFLASLGGVICDSLDGCQCCGTTYDELYNFCCCSENTIADMKDNIREGNSLFSDLVSINCPDYKYKGDFFDTCNYAPITHAVNKYMCQKLKEACKNDETRDTLNNKLFEIFPEMRDNCIIKSVDENGDTIFADLDGNIINTD